MNRADSGALVDRADIGGAEASYPFAPDIDCGAGGCGAEERGERTLGLIGVGVGNVDRSARAEGDLKVGGGDLVSEIYGGDIGEGHVSIMAMGCDI